MGLLPHCSTSQAEPVLWPQERSAESSASPTGPICIRSNSAHFRQDESSLSLIDLVVRFAGKGACSRRWSEEDTPRPDFCHATFPTPRSSSSSGTNALPNHGLRSNILCALDRIGREQPSPYQLVICASFSSDSLQRKYQKGTKVHPYGTRNCEVV